MKLLAKIYCFLFGHDMISEGEFDNGISKYGEYGCLRCGKRHYWQYDNIQKNK